MSNEQNRPGLKIKNFNYDFLVICRFSRYFNADEFEGIEGAVSPYNIINYLCLYSDSVSDRYNSDSVSEDLYTELLIKAVEKRPVLYRFH